MTEKLNSLSFLLYKQQCGKYQYTFNIRTFCEYQKGDDTDDNQLLAAECELLFKKSGKGGKKLV